MRRVRYSVAMSLDGYIAGPKGETDWIIIDPEIDFGALMGAFDTILLGRKTYEATRQQGGGSAMPGMEAYVFSRTLDPGDCPGVTVSDNPTETLAVVKAKRGKDIWLFGGGSLFRSLLGLGLVDTVEVAVIPVLLGGGSSLLPQPAERAPLTLTKHRVFRKTGTVSLEYAVTSGAA
jgi:dihydrofolate reductase